MKGMKGMKGMKYLASLNNDYGFVSVDKKYSSSALDIAITYDFLFGKHGETVNVIMKAHIPETEQLVAAISVLSSDILEYNPDFDDNNIGGLKSIHKIEDLSIDEQLNMLNMLNIFRSAVMKFAA